MKNYTGKCNYTVECNFTDECNSFKDKQLDCDYQNNNDKKHDCNHDIKGKTAYTKTYFLLTNCGMGVESNPYE